jgi:outer membrane cobalamin receptor
MPLKCRILLATICLAGTSAESIAAKDTPAAEYDLELESVRVTATRRPARSLDVAEAVTLVDATRISREAPRVLAELLRGQAGTFFQQTTPGQGLPVIRGLKGSEVLHLVDGMRLNNAFFRNAPSQYVALVDGQAVDRVEIVRGSAPSLHGADAMGGVMQVLTYEPDFTADTWQHEGRIYATFNSVDDSATGRASAAAGKDGSALSGGITWQEFGDRSVGGGTTVAPTAFQVHAGDLKWRQSLSPSLELMLAAQVLDQPSTPRIDELTPGYGQDQPS